MCLSLGSFRWHTEFRGTETAPGHDEQGPDLQLALQNQLIVYRVTLLGPTKVKPRQIFIMPFTPATALSPNASCFAQLHSPLAGVLELYCVREQIRQHIIATTVWNSQKHICLSENVDLKDQTTTGIQLLDDLRRYKPTGTHSVLRDGSACAARTITI